VLVEAASRFEEIESHNPWKRVDEELPKHFGDYFVTYVNSYLDRNNEFVTKKEISVEHFGHSAVTGPEFITDKRVIYWMEKPPFPESSEE
jgi:hypothetical protein